MSEVRISDFIKNDNPEYKNFTSYGIENENE